MWWIALIGVVWSVFNLFTIVPAVLFSLGTTSFMTISYGFGYGSNSQYWLIALVSLVSFIATTILLGLAVSPLKVLSKRGWDLLFAAFVVQLALRLLSMILTVALLFSAFDVTGIFSGLLSLALSAIIGGYFIFKIRGEFGKKKALDTKAAAKA